MLEGAKLVAAMFWLVGLVFLFLVPPFGLFVLFIAILISIFTAAKTKEQRHDEIVSAVDTAASPSAGPTPPSVPRPPPSDRLAELDRLREAGVVSNVEYQAKRRQILDEI
jgi:hypothetical protein